MMVHMFRATLLALALWTISFLSACGGAGANDQNAPVGASGAGGQAPGAVSTPPADTGGIAGQGEACDYGGAERYTCSGGLECCYGEHQRPDGYGTCQAECNWD